MDITPIAPYQKSTERGCEQLHLLWLSKVITKIPNMIKTISLTTPMISVNKMYRGRRFLSKEGKDTKTAIAWEIASKGKFEPKTTPVAINIVFYVKNNRADLDNMLKALLDCLTGIVYTDDSLITELHIFKEIDKVNPRTEISIL